jgi:hypothetical protein
MKKEAPELSGAYERTTREMRSSEKKIDRSVEPVTSVSGGFSAGVM